MSLNPKKLNKALKDLQAICEDMGWQLGLPFDGALGEGFMIGNYDYLATLNQIFGEMTVYETPENPNKEDTSTKRGPTFH